jgi:hypothetical protein
MQRLDPSGLCDVPAEASLVELPLFSHPQCFVHANIPPCDTLGHKADTWNVAKPDFICKVAVFTRGDSLIIRLRTQEDELFAESFWEPDSPMHSVRPLPLLQCQKNDEIHETAIKPSRMFGTVTCQQFLAEYPCIV